MALTGAELTRALGRGISLGRTFETVKLGRDKVRVSKMLDAFKRTGFQHVRIPVTWFPASAPEGVLQDATFMEQLKDAVDHAVSLGLGVILDAHHESWLDDGFDGSPEIEAKFTQLWRDIATTFDYVPQDKLVFEVLNEPAGVFGDTGGSAKPEDPAAIQRTRRVNQLGFEAIRAVNPTRGVALQPNGKGNIAYASSVYPTASTLPGGGTDPYIIVTVHSYDPWAFAGQTGSDDYFLQKPDPMAALHRSVGGRIDNLAAWHARLNGSASVLLTEYGVGRKNQHELDSDLVREYLKAWSDGFDARGWGVSVWDDGSWFAITYWPNGANGDVEFLYRQDKAVLGQL